MSCRCEGTGFVLVTTGSFKTRSGRRYPGPRVIRCPDYVDYFRIRDVFDSVDRTASCDAAVRRHVMVKERPGKKQKGKYGAEFDE